jgi:MFS family permease
METHDSETKKEIESSKKYSLKDAAAVNATVGLGENYISAYQIALNANPNQIGFLTSIPNLIAPLIQLKTSKYMEKHRRKKIVSIAVLIQALMWLPIIGVSFLFLENITYAPVLLIVFYTIYASFGNLASPAWISWMGDLVGSKEAGKFFGLRNKIGGLSALLAMILGGIILDLFRHQASTPSLLLIFIGFAVIFSLAMFSRLLSRHFVMKQYEPPFKFEKGYYFSFFQFIKKIPKSNFGRFSLYVALITMVTNIAGPYYAMYMLKNLGFTYTEFMIITVSASVATFIFIMSWGKFSDRFGNIQMMKVCSLFIPLICFMWPVGVYFIPDAYRFAFLILINFISGFAWAGFNLAAGNFVFDAATPQRRGLCSAYSSVLNGAGIMVGVTIGSLLISHLKIEFMNVVMFMSLVSGICRYGVYLLFFSSVKEVREVERSNWKMIPIPSEIYNIHNQIKRGLSFRFRIRKKVEVPASVPYHLPKKD